MGYILLQRYAQEDKVIIVAEVYCPIDKTSYAGRAGIG